ncbi:TIGR00282 family metallophosphoesterase [Oceanibium sediminis]|uniref:TIGR00282 family metallophosphoesterase n=1 Tax=Oceanibium sediminis TaxID=2026339 RepID=UPI000DD4584A|nr:TIGR00282 family metallophosphoesterase [Oceanibium sediminis]
MRILFLGDVVGRSGRSAVLERVAQLRQDLKLDFLIVNGENASAGMGLSATNAREFLEAGIDCLTLGDHAFDQRDMLAHIDSEPRILRPLNFAKTAPGKGAHLFRLADGRRVYVAQVLGQVFMKRPYDDPFSQIDRALKAAPLGGLAQAVIVDIHAEATSEKMAMGHWCDGRASLVVGTHTHVPTADAQILPKGTAYLSDAGMCGDYLSVIGMDREEPLSRFVTGMVKGRFTPASGEASVCGVLVVTDDKTGRATAVEPLRLGGRLADTTQGG